VLSFGPFPACRHCAGSGGDDGVPGAAGSKGITVNRSVKRLAKGVIVLAPLTYFFPGLMIFYFLCGIYDVTRNTNLSWRVVEAYFLGNGVLTWVLSPFNVAMDILSLPFINKGVYKLEDLPEGHQDEIRRLIVAVNREDLVGKLEQAVAQESRTMFFFKWYGANTETIIDIPAFHEQYRYIKTIGVSVFNKKQSTSKHFGPIRATLRLLYNINTMEDRSAYIEVGDTINYWQDQKMFIFDDTLQHQSFNESDKVRYCMFVDVVRPAGVHQLLAGAVWLNRVLTSKINGIFYKQWKLVQR
jgi:beta-hydroxylase